MPDHYTFEGGEFNPVTQVDVIPEQEKLNQKIERSEDDYFQALRQNEADRIQNVKDFWDGLGDISKSLKGAAEAQHKKFVEEEEARGAMAAIESDYNWEDLQALKDEEGVMKAEHIQLSKIGSEVEEETGRFIFGQEFRNMSKWAQYSFVKNILLREGADYKMYKQQALQEVEIEIDRGDGKGPVRVGGQEKGGIRDASNEAEANAMEAKVKQDFMRRFAGYPPVLLQATLKEKIETVDNADQAQRAKDFDDQAKEFAEEQETLDLVDNIRSSPSSGREHIDFWIEKNKWKYNGNVSLTRDALGDKLVDAVKKGDLSLFEAMGVVKERIANRGTKKDVDMTHWKEWRNLETRLYRANSDFMEEGEDFIEDAMKADAELLSKANRQLTAEEAAAYVKRHRELYPGKAIPDEAWNFLNGWENDDALRQVLDKKILKNGGVTEKDLEGASPTLYDEYSNAGKIIRNGYERISSVAELGRDQTTFVRNRVANGMTLTLGTGETTSLEFDLLLKQASKDFVDDYNYMLNLEGDPAKALKHANDNLVRNVINNENGYRETYTSYAFTADNKGRQDALTAAQDVIKPRSGGFRVTKLPVTDDDLQELKEWAASDGKDPVPTFYAFLASENGIYAPALAAAQAALHGFEVKAKVDESQLKKLPPAVQKLLTYKPSPTSVEIAKKEYERSEEEDINKLPTWQQSTNLRNGL